MSTKCPCHSNLAYALCCEPFHKGALPSTALELMRSRYSAYVLKLIEYIQQTETKPPSRKSLERFCNETTFTGLTILAFTDNAVKFAVHTTTGSWQEESHFIQKEGRWLFLSIS